MWFLGNKREPVDIRGLTQNFHRERTQKINNKPPLEDLEEGFIRCVHCGVEITQNQHHRYPGINQARRIDCVARWCSTLASYAVVPVDAVHHGGRDLKNETV